MKQQKVNILYLGILLVFAALLTSCQRASRAPEQPLVLLPQPGASPVVALTPTPIPTPAPTATPLPLSRVENGDRALFYGDWEKALKEFTTAFESSDDPQVQEAALLGIGQAWMLGRNDYEAEKALQRLLTEYPEAPQIADAYFHLGQMYQRQEEYAKAVEAYSQYIGLRAGVIDAVVLTRRGDAYFALADYPAASADYQAALAAPGLQDTIQLRLKLARAYALAGDTPTALSLYDDLAQRASDHPTLSLILLRKAEIFAADGETEKANQTYMQVVNSYPTTYNAYLALSELVDKGVAVDELLRGIIDYHAGQYGVALAAFDRYLQNNPADAAAAHYYYGLTHRALGESEKAIQRWDKVISDFPNHSYWDEAWEEKAYTQWAFLGDYSAAVKTLMEFAESASGHPRAAEFLFDAALVAERDRKLEQAIEIWERLASYYPNDERVPRSIFLAGISRYRLGQFELASQTFQRYLGLSTSLTDKTTAYFWIGKAQEKTGQTAQARANWETLAGMDPTGYYSERARDLLHNRAPFTPPRGYDLTSDPLVEQSKAEAWLRTTFGLPAESDLSGLGDLAIEPGLQRGLELWRLGLWDEARAEFEQLRLLNQDDPLNSYRLARFLAQLGMYRPAVMAARQVLNLALMDDAQTLSAPLYFNRIRFGTYYSDLVIPLAQEYGFHPLFLFSIIRQESLFESFVRSSAGARGLMQIMPATGKELAQNQDWLEDYQDDDLFRPMVNLRLGVIYLHKQRQAFNGNLYATLAAYNGGPGNAAAWLKLAPDDPDLFLEVVRYPETRNYIRHIYEIFSIYRMIYDRSP